MFTATYSPDDNKLRLYSTTRLDSETYARVKAAGFKWAPKQQLFVAPMWTPEREDLLIELAEEIGDEDTSLTDRAEARADRFEEYSEKRAKDSEAAHAAVSVIADNIPLGQPILVGHHSEKRARKDQQRIESGMRRAVKMWQTAEYWERRAAGALRHAKYKERPDVRARRIKKIEADLRRVERSIKEVLTRRALWASVKNEEQARAIAAAGHFVVKREGTTYWTAYDVLKPDGERYAACPAMTWEQVRDQLSANAGIEPPRPVRWREHYENRLKYERAMLADQGASHLLEKKPRPKQPPLLNFRAGNIKLQCANPWRRGEILTHSQVEMTKAEYAKIWSEHRATRTSLDGSYRFRIAIQRVGSSREDVAVFLTDSKEHAAPKPAEQQAAE